MTPRAMYPRLILVAVIGLVYANTFMNSFHFDDVTSILEKPWVRGIEKISFSHIRPQMQGGCQWPSQTE